MKIPLREMVGRLRHSLQGVADCAAALVLPAHCPLCQGVMTVASRLPVCPTCLERFPRFASPLCARCGYPFPTSTAAALCHRCRRHPLACDGLRCYGPYQEPAVGMIQLLKHRPITPLARWFAARLADLVVEEPLLAATDAIVPVPLDRRRLRQRGFNQAELIARCLARRLRIPMRPELLVRVVPRPEKLLLTARQRRESVRGAFLVPPGQRVDRMRILLIDDVVTTGATLDACARALKAAGAERVTALCVARSLRTS